MSKFCLFLRGNLSSRPTTNWSTVNLASLNRIHMEIRKLKVVLEKRGINSCLSSGTEGHQFFFLVYT